MSSWSDSESNEEKGSDKTWDPSEDVSEEAGSDEGEGPDEAPGYYEVADLMDEGDVELQAEYQRKTRVFVSKYSSLCALPSCSTRFVPGNTEIIGVFLKYQHWQTFQGRENDTKNYHICAAHDFQDDDDFIDDRALLLNDSEDDSDEDSDEDSDDPQPSTSRGPSQRLAAKKTDNPELVKNRRKRHFQNNSRSSSSSSNENEQHAEKKILIGDDSDDEIEVEAQGGDPVPSPHHEPSEHEVINQEEIYEEEEEPDHEDMNQEEIYEEQEDLINDYSSNQEESSNYSSYIICDKYIDEIWPRDDD